MKKFEASPQSAKRIKAIVAAAMAITLAVPTTAYFSSKASKVEAEGAMPTAVATVTMENGFVGEKKANGLEVVKSEEVIEFKELTEVNGVVQYNGMSEICEVTDKLTVQAGQYKYQVVGNQPSTAYDEHLGATLVFDNTVEISEFAKKEDDEMTNVPIGTVVQKATVTHSQVQMNNPFAGKDLANGASVSYWVKVPAVSGQAVGANTPLVVFSTKDAENQKSSVNDEVAKKAEMEADGKLSVQIAAGNDFHYVTDTVSASYEGDGSILAAPDKWAYVTVAMTDNKVVTYVDGKEVLNKDVEATGLMTSLADSNTSVFFGGNYSPAAEKVGQNYPSVRNTAMDEISFYTQAITAEEAAQLYNAAVEKANYVDEVEVLEKFTFENGFNGDNGTVISGMEGNKKDPEVVVDSERGNVLKMNAGTAFKPSGAKLSANPFSGKNLDGATISYWVKVPYNTKLKSVGVSPALSFISEPMSIEHDKLQETYKDKLHRTVLYTQTDLEAYFYEGVDSQAYDSVKNYYKFSLRKYAGHLDGKTDSNGNVIDPLYDADGVAKEEKYKEMANTFTSWHRVTAVFTNAGIKMYYDGEPLTNNVAKLDNTPLFYGSRFFDGYYQMQYDGYAKFYRAGNNQGAKTLMSFLTADNTNANIGYTYKLGTTNAMITYEAYYDDITYYASALTDEQVLNEYKTANGEEVVIPSVEPVASEQPGSDPSQGDVVGDVIVPNEDGTLVADGAGVKVEVPAGVLPEGLGITMGTVGTADTATYDSFKNTFAGIADYNVKDYVVYSITADDATVTPNGTFKLTFDIPEGYDTTSLVVIDENGKQYAVTVSADGKKATIEGVDHFGKFALAVKEVSKDDESVVAPKNAYTGKTGDTANVVVPVVALSVAAAAVAVASKKRKETEE